MYEKMDTHTHYWVIVPVQQLVLSIALAVVRMTEDCIQTEVEAITLSIQLVSGHARQTIEIRLVHCQQWRRQFSDKVILLVALTQHRFTHLLEPTISLRPLSTKMVPSVF